MNPVSGREDLQHVRFRNRFGYDDRVLSRAAERGELVRVRPGVYAATPVWSALDGDQRTRLTVAAALDRSARPLIASHWSAAALLGAPTLRHGGAPVHVLTTRAAGSRSEHGFVKHAVSDFDRDVVVEDGLACTSLPRTVVDIATTARFSEALAVADWALGHGMRREEGFAVLDELRPTRGRRRAVEVLETADARSGSVGESVSRAVMHVFGLPAPELQVAFSDAWGFIGIVDFFWADFGLIGEFDGRVKYSDPVMLGERSAADVVVAEKRREDRLRATGPRVVRWVWRDLEPQQQLVRILGLSGLPTGRSNPRA